MMIFISIRKQAGRIALAALAAAFLASCGQNSPQQLMASAKEYLAKGDRDAAVIQLKNLLSKSPNNGEARLLLGETLLENEDFASAEKELARALELKQPQEKVLPAYTRALLAQGKHQAVINEVEKYKLFNPLAVAATQTAFGDALAQLGKRPRAREAYKAALAAVPDYAKAQIGEARLLAAEGNLAEALSLIDSVITTEPKLAEARALRGELLLVSGERSGARSAFEEAIEADGDYLPARLALIGLLIEDGNIEAAVQQLNATRKVAPRNLRVTYLDALVEYRQGRMQKARERVQEVLKYVPEHVPSLVLAGSIDLKEQQFVSAEDNLRKALARAPGHLGARQLLVTTYLRTGQPMKATEILDPILMGKDKALPSDPRLLLLAGEAYLAAGDLQRAAIYFQAATKGKSAEQVAARTRLGQIALAGGRSEEGFAELEAAAELDADSFHPDLALIAAHLRRNEIDKAMGAARSLEKKQPKNPLTFQLLGVINLAKKDFAAARSSFEKALEVQPGYLPAAYELARLDIEQKKPDDARKRYEAMIAREPKNEQTYLALAELQARNPGSSPGEVSATLRRAIEASPQAPAARIALIDHQLRAGDTKAALVAAQDALAAIPSDPRLLDVAGLAQEAAGEVNQAIGTYNKLASLQPQSAHPLYRLAALYMEQKNVDMAADSLRRVQRISPREGDVSPQLVQVFIAAKRYDDAIKEARELQRRAPGAAGGWVLEGDISFAQRRFADAEKMYRHALKLDPTLNAVAIKLFVVLASSGRQAEAEALAKKWIAENPKDVAMRLFLGDNALASRNLKSAAAHYQSVVAIEPNNALALNNLAWTSGELGDPKAISYAARAVELAPNNPSYLETLGTLWVRKGEPEKALPVLRRACDIAPARNDLRVSYAKALIKAGRKEDARTELESVTKAKGNFAGKDEVPALLKGL